MMRCLPFFCSSRHDPNADTDASAKASTVQPPKAQHPSAQAASSSPPYVDGAHEASALSSTSSLSSQPVGPQLPSPTQALSQTAQASVAWSKAAQRTDRSEQRQQEAAAEDGVELAERNEAIKQAFTTPDARRQLSTAAVVAAVPVSTPSSDDSPMSTSLSSSPSAFTSISTAATVVSPPPSTRALPPPHPGTHSRRQSIPLAPDAHFVHPAPARASTHPHVRSISSSASKISPSFQPTASHVQAVRSSSQPPSPFSTASSASLSRTPKAQSTPLRARRLQRHRALSQSSPHSALVPRSSHIGSSAHLAAFFASSAALSLMRDRLLRGVIVLQHTPGEEPRYKHVFCSASLTRLHYTDLPATASAIPQPGAESAKQPHILASSLHRVTKGLSTKSFIAKQTELGEHAQAPLNAGLLLSLCSPTVALDLECVSEVERDEWFLTFDFLLEYWNQWRRQNADSPLSLSAQPALPAPPTLPAHNRRGSWLGAVVGLYEQHDRLARQSQGKADQPPPPALLTPPVSSRRLSVSLASTASPYSGGRGGLSEYELYAVMGRYVSDIEAVREANRLLLVDDCARMIDMQAQVDAIRLDNARLIDQLAPAADY